MKRIHIDPCGHDKKFFQGNIELSDGLIGDLYIYPANVAGTFQEDGTLHYCLRFSSGEEDFISGKVKNLFYGRA